jgi:hypothetical protein
MLLKRYAQKKKILFGYYVRAGVVPKMEEENG